MNDPTFRELDDAEKRLLVIEHATAREVVGRLDPVFKRALAVLVATWPGDDAVREEQQAALRRADPMAVDGVLPDVESAILNGALEAQQEGHRAAYEMAALAGVVIALRSGRESLSIDTREDIRRVGAVVREHVTLANVLFKQATTLSSAQAGLVLAAKSTSRAESIARTATNKASNEAITESGESSTQLISVWRTEPGACLRCLAYAGETNVGGSYPADLTYGRPTSTGGPVAMPPLHPRCRCRQWLIERASVPEVSRTLKREAERAVLRGWSMPSESDKARLDAAQRLLASGTSLPKSVQEYAARAVRNGEFPQGRAHPAP